MSKLDRQRIHTLSHVNSDFQTFLHTKMFFKATITSTVHEHCEVVNGNQNIIYMYQ